MIAAGAVGSAMTANMLIETHISENGELSQPSTSSFVKRNSDESSGNGAAHKPLVLSLKKVHYDLLSRVIPDPSYQSLDNIKDVLDANTDGEGIIGLVVHVHEDTSSPRLPVRVAVMDASGQLFCCVICRNADGCISMLHAGCLISLQRYRVVEHIFCDLASIRPFVHIFDFHVLTDGATETDDMETEDHYFVFSDGAIDTALSFGEAIFCPLSMSDGSNACMLQHRRTIEAAGMEDHKIVMAELVARHNGLSFPVVYEEGTVEYRQYKGTHKAMRRRSESCECLSAYHINGCIASLIPPAFIETYGEGVPQMLKVDPTDAKSYYHWHSHNIDLLPTTHKEGCLPQCLQRAINQHCATKKEFNDEILE